MSRAASASRILRALGAATLLATAGAEDPPDLATQIGAKVRSVLDQCRDAVCRVEADDDHGPVVGTGFIVDADGTLFTTYSVGGETDDIVVTIGDEKYPATRLLADPRSGIAILKADAAKPLPFIACGKAQELEMATPVIVLGYPLSLPLSPSFGIVSGFEIGYRGRYFATRHIRASVPAQRGEGGAPVLNFKGEAVGILISTLGEHSGILALPIEAAAKVLRDCRESRRVRQGWIGADVRMTGAPEHGSSARIREVRRNSPGFEGGLRPGDVILDVGGWKITSPEDVLNASFYITVGEPLKIRVSRAGRPLDVMVTPGESPDGEGPSIQQAEPEFLGTVEAAPGR